MIEANPQLEDSSRLSQTVVQVRCLRVANVSASFLRSAGLGIFAAALFPPTLQDMVSSVPIMSEQGRAPDCSTVAGSPSRQTASIPTPATALQEYPRVETRVETAERGASKAAPQGKGTREFKSDLKGWTGWSCLLSLYLALCASVFVCLCLVNLTCPRNSLAAAYLICATLQTMVR